MLGQIFNDNKKSDIPKQEQISDLQRISEGLKRKQEILEEKIQEEIEFARDNAASNKIAALQALRRKRYFENQQHRFDNELQKIETDPVTNLDGLKVESSEDESEKLEKLDMDQLHLSWEEFVKIEENWFEASKDESHLQVDISDTDLMAELDEIEQEFSNQKR